MDVDVEAVARAGDVLAEQASSVGFANRVVERLDLGQHLAAHIDVRSAHAERPAGADHAFDEQVRITAHQQPVFEGAGLAFVGVDHQVDRLAGIAWHERPLHAGGKAGAATAAQAAVLDRLDNLEGALVEQGRADGAVGAVGPGDLEAVAVGHIEQAAQHARQFLTLKTSWMRHGFRPSLGQRRPARRRWR